MVACVCVGVVVGVSVAAIVGDMRVWVVVGCVVAGAAVDIVAIVGDDVVVVFRCAHLLLYGYGKSSLEFLVQRGSS